MRQERTLGCDLCLVEQMRECSPCVMLWSMVSTVSPRALTPNEVSILRAVVTAVGGPAAEALNGQIAEASVVGGLPTFLDLAVTSGPSAAISNGPLPVRASVSEPSG